MNVHTTEISKCHIVELGTRRHAGCLADAICEDQMIIAGSNMKMCALMEHVAAVPVPALSSIP